VLALPAAPRRPMSGLIDPDPAGLARALAARGVVASPRGDVLRLSFHYYNDSDDVTACARP